METFISALSGTGKRYCGVFHGFPVATGVTGVCSICSVCSATSVCSEYRGGFLGPNIETGSEGVLPWNNVAGLAVSAEDGEDGGAEEHLGDE